MASIKLTKLLEATNLHTLWALENATQALIGPNLTYALDVNGTLSQNNLDMYRDMKKIDTTNCPFYSNGQFVLPQGYNVSSGTCLPSNSIIVEDLDGEQITIGCFGDNDEERIADCTTKLRPYLVNTLTTSHSSNVSLVRRGDDNVAKIVGGVAGAALPAIGGMIYAGYKVYASKNKVEISKPKMVGFGNNGLCGKVQTLEDFQYSSSEIMSQVASDSVIFDLAESPEIGKHVLHRFTFIG